MTSPPDSASPTYQSNGTPLANCLLWLLLAAAIFEFPKFPTLELDASWRMALGWFLQEGFQFGRDVVFTYGPLGFWMGNTYSGPQFGSLVAWQLAQSVVFAGIIIAFARGLSGVPRAAYFIFFLLFGVIYQDALHMIIIALLGIGLIRRSEEAGRAQTIGAGLLLAVIAMVKFTNLLFATFVVVVTVAYRYRTTRERRVLALPAWYFGGYIVLWMVCGQNPINLPSYLINSWEISQGYQETMGIPTPFPAFWRGVVVCVLLSLYLGIYLLLRRNQAPRALAFGAITAALLFLNWKHGFVRSDGHMIGFFICALVPIAGFPVLLEDSPRFRSLQRCLLIPAAFLSIAGIHAALPPVVSRAAGLFHEKLWNHGYHLVHWKSYRGSFDDRLRDQKEQHRLSRVQEAVGDAPVDVLGHEQAIALFNDLNYRPRPVPQGYSVYTPRLARLNRDFYLSERAPEFALLKIQTIDERLPTLDDSHLLNIFPHLYQYVLSEKGFQLWRRRDTPPDPATLEPRRLRTLSAEPGVSVDIADLIDRHVWAEIDFRPSLIGKVRSFLYKPPFVRLALLDSAGGRTDYRLPLSQARAGFIINPIVENIVDYIHFSGGRPERKVQEFSIEVAGRDRKFFKKAGGVGLFALTPSTAAAEFLSQAERERFWMLKTAPVSYGAYGDPSQGTIDDRTVIVMHAPSEMEFICPADATLASGSFGFMPGAYQDGGNTNGAGFRVIWTDGREEIVLFDRYLDPREAEADRGLQDFQVDLSGVPDGRLRFEIDPGPDNDISWDWTAWTDIEIR